MGHPVQCAGLVSQRVLDLAGSRATVLDAVAGATVFGPSLGSVSFAADGPRAFVIDRAGLDVALADRAAQAEPVPGRVRFDRAERPPGGPVRAELTDSSGASVSVEARLLVGADGVASAVARAVRLRRRSRSYPPSRRRSRARRAMPARSRCTWATRSRRGSSAGGSRMGTEGPASAWRPPPGRSRPGRYYDRLVRQVERRFSTHLPGPTALLVSGIPIGTLPHTTTDRALLVGDAAAQVKPLSGGGIFTGMRCAEIAAEVADRCLRTGDLSAAALSAYRPGVAGRARERVPGGDVPAPAVHTVDRPGPRPGRRRPAGGGAEGVDRRVRRHRLPVARRPPAAPSVAVARPLVPQGGVRLARGGAALAPDLGPGRRRTAQ